MITHYLELHSYRDNLRNLIPLSWVGPVGEIERDLPVDPLKPKGLMNKVKLCSIVIINPLTKNEQQYVVCETYDEIKAQINKVYFAMRDDEKKGQIQ